MNPIDLAQFWSRVSVGQPSRCWKWNGQLPKGDAGYGRFRGEAAHRIAYCLVHGDIPDGAVLRHTCDNRRCCNPAHLVPGTSAENTADAIERGRLATGARHGRTKLIAEQVAVIRSSQERQSVLAEHFGVSVSTISYIKSGRSWKHAA